MIVDPPRSAWYRRDEVPPAGEDLARQLGARDAATARALQAYLATRPAGAVRSTLTTAL